ncbi:hypothetical protein NUW54_g7619 [Trametes sanguinea]|uniref:Uncharacterized protein n=1 Tax=Trametes sanguinea TaxID=158606 RepID=A0ACC1PM32_9APHY|nr:hypothetical protein NUW54_g7619 [Trametes sanguinea]
MKGEGDCGEHPLLIISDQYIDTHLFPAALHERVRGDLQGLANLPSALGYNAELLDEPEPVVGDELADPASTNVHDSLCALLDMPPCDLTSKASKSTSRRRITFEPPCKYGSRRIAVAIIHGTDVVSETAFETLVDRSTHSTDTGARARAPRAGRAHALWLCGALLLSRFAWVWGSYIPREGLWERIGDDDRESLWLIWKGRAVVDAAFADHEPGECEPTRSAVCAGCARCAARMTAGSGREGWLRVWKELCRAVGTPRCGRSRTRMHTKKEET